jgi:hypothetical protein
MGKARSILLDTRHFSNARDATAFFSSMLQRYPIGATLTDEDQEDIKGLLKRHDEVGEKIGCGISCVQVAHSPPPYDQQRCF